MPHSLDRLDLDILTRLQDEARLSNVELAEAVHLSPSPCLARVRRLEEEGVINRYVALLDPAAVGLTVSVFIQVRLEKQVERALEVFEKAIAVRPEVMECYLMTGDSDYLLRVLVPDVPAFERFIVDFLSRVPGVGNLKSSFSLKQVKYKTSVPLEEPERSTGSRGAKKRAASTGRRSRTRAAP